MAKNKTLSGKKAQTATIAPQARVQKNDALPGVDSEAECEKLTMHRMWFHLCCFIDDEET